MRIPWSDTNLKRATFGVICLIGAIFASSALADPATLPTMPGSDPVAAADHSLTTQQYLDLGVPPIDKPWDFDQFAQAGRVFQTIADKDPTQLPRFRSANSGAVFDRLTAQDNLDRYYDSATSPQDRLTQLGGIPRFLSVFNAYNGATKPSQALDAELLRLGGFILKLELATCVASDQLLAAMPELKNDPKSAAGLKQVRDGSAQSTSGMIELMMDHANVRRDQAVQFAPEFGQVLKTLVPKLLPDAQANIRKQLQTDIDGESDAALKSALQGVLDALPAAQP